MGTYSTLSRWDGTDKPGNIGYNNIKSLLCRSKGTTRMYIYCRKGFNFADMTFKLCPVLVQLKTWP